MELTEEMKNRIIKKNNEGKYSLFSTDVVNKAINSPHFEIYYDIVAEWDEQCNIPIDLGNYLNEAMRDENNLVAFSRVYIAGLETNGIVSDEIIDIATNGLKNNGHINSSGVSQEVNSPSDALSPLVGLEGWINLVGSYKKNNAIILYSLPKKIIDDDCHFIDERYADQIYNFDNDLTYFKPEYLMGMVVKNKDVVDVFLTKEDMLNMNNNKTR